MSDRPPSDRGRLSPQTLVVASLASLTAAIVTSTFWRGGTPITAAITPVIVAIASELYSRPARKITEYSSRAAASSRARRTSAGLPRERTAVGAPSRRPPEPPLREPDDPSLGPIRVYRTESAPRPSIRRVHLKVALATAALAFVIAAVALTVPELVFGGSVASHGRTTLFGGGHRHRSHNTNQNTQTTPGATTPTQSTPTQTTTTPTQPPAQTTPQTTTPATPAPQGATPPSGATGPSG